MNNNFINNNEQQKKVCVWLDFQPSYILFSLFLFFIILFTWKQISFWDSYTTFYLKYVLLWKHVLLRKQLHIVFQYNDFLISPEVLLFFCQKMFDEAIKI